MTKITPVEIALVGTATQLQVIVQSFATNATKALTTNKLLDDSENVLLCWDYELTELEFAAWGADNSIVEQFVADNKGIKIIN